MRCRTPAAKRHPEAPVHPLAAMPGADRVVKRAAMMLARPRASDYSTRGFTNKPKQRNKGITVQ
jgi:hypothetical protein